MSDAADTPYPQVESPDLPSIERRILAGWAAHETFEQSVDQRPVGNGSKNNEYVFYFGRALLQL